MRRERESTRHLVSSANTFADSKFSGDDGDCCCCYGCFSHVTQLWWYAIEMWICGCWGGVAMAWSGFLIEVRRSTRASINTQNVPLWTLSLFFVMIYWRRLSVYVFVFGWFELARLFTIVTYTHTNTFMTFREEEPSSPILALAISMTMKQQQQRKNVEISCDFFYRSLLLSCRHWFSFISFRFKRSTHTHKYLDAGWSYKVAPVTHRTRNPMIYVHEIFFVVHTYKYNFCSHSFSSIRFISFRKWALASNTRLHINVLFASFFSLGGRRVHANSKILSFSIRRAWTEYTTSLTTYISQC